MIAIIFILLFISLYGLSIIGNRMGAVFFGIALSLHLCYIIFRWSFLGRFPVTERHDILMIIAIGIALSILYMRKKVSLNLLFNILPMFIITLCFFSLFQERINTIEPNMNSAWFYAHMILFVIGYSLLITGSATGILYLKEKTHLLEIVQYKLSLSGWVIFSLSLIAGSVWFFLVHGVYWLWSAKELWTTITWLYYSFYLHARMIGTLRGRPASIFGIAGVGIILFSYLGVTPILGSPWTQF